jgi:hypothetical protein
MVFDSSRCVNVSETDFLMGSQIEYDVYYVNCMKQPYSDKIAPNG